MVTKFNKIKTYLKCPLLIMEELFENLYIKNPINKIGYTKNMSIK